MTPKSPQSELDSKDWKDWNGQCSQSGSPILRGDTEAEKNGLSLYLLLCNHHILDADHHLVLLNSILSTSPVTCTQHAIDQHLNLLISNNV